MRLEETTGYVAGLSPELNIRELGGLPADAGRRVRRGLIFRGGALVGLTGPERRRIDELRLFRILDLRARGEAEAAPDYRPASASYLRCAGMRNADGSEVDFSPASIKRFEREQKGQGGLEGLMRRLYISMAFGNPATHALVRQLVDHAVPLYVHCTAGKDRTGVCAIICGLVLGIPHDALLDDFMLTNEYRRTIIEGVARRLPPDTPPEVVERWQKANGVELADAQALLDAIFERHGSAEAYLASEFGLDATDLMRLRERYLD